MKITVKLFTFLKKYLPAGARLNQAVINVDENASAGSVLNALNVPRSECKIILVNGTYTAPDDADGVNLKDGDVLAAWPPSTG